MVDLLKNKKNNYKLPEKELKPDKKAVKERQSGQKTEIHGQQNKSPRKVSLSRYKDLEGLTMKKLSIGLWLIKNRRNMLFLLYGFLIAISVISWSLFFYTYGFYIIKGMKDDQAMLAGLALENLAGQDFFLERSAKNIQQGRVQVIRTLGGKYDFLIQIKNPNQRHWLEFEYYFKAGEQEFGRAQNFILPGESKYLLALGQTFERPISGVELYMDDLRWQRIDVKKFSDWDKFKNSRLAISARDVKFTPAGSNRLTEKLSLNNLEFFADNNSAYNYYNVNFVILLFSNNRIVGVNKYALNDFMSGQSRKISLAWPGTINKVNDTLIVPEINITRDDIYIGFDSGSGEEK